MKQIAVAVVLSLAGTLVFASDASDLVERARIREERTQAQRLFEERERTCQTQFVVTSCLDDARHARRETLERLRHQELVLENAVRKQRAAARSAQIREKQAAKESRPPPMVVRERQAATLPPPTGQASASAPTTREPRTPASARNNAELERRQKAAFDAKQQEAAAHRAEVERRNAEHAKKAKPVAPLPAPKAASGQ